MDPVVVAIVLVGLFVLVVGLIAVLRAFGERDGQGPKRR
jgi:uncharacterized membrane protein HdeD (DUF308 family)